MAEITLHDAIKRMRSLTTIGVSFSFEFYSYNSSTGKSDGIKQVLKGMLRHGLRYEKSQKANVLIGYKCLTGDKDRFFYLPLLLKFNGHTIKA
jgi:hypothetical protein